MGQLKKAALRHERVELIYEAKNRKLTQRQVTVYTVTKTHAFCYCHLKEAYRAFVLSQILSSRPVSKPPYHNQRNALTIERLG